MLHKLNIISMGSANRTLRCLHDVFKIFVFSYNFICWYTGHVLCIDVRPRPLNFFVQQSKRLTFLLPDRLMSLHKYDRVIG